MSCSDSMYSAPPGVVEAPPQPQSTGAWGTPVRGTNAPRRPPWQGLPPLNPLIYNYYFYHLICFSYELRVMVGGEMQELSQAFVHPASVLVGKLHEIRFIIKNDSF